MQCEHNGNNTRFLLESDILSVRVLSLINHRMIQGEFTLSEVLYSE